MNKYQFIYLRFNGYCISPSLRFDFYQKHLSILSFPSWLKGLIYRINVKVQLFITGHTYDQINGAQLRKVNHPGRICAVLNDRSRRKTEVYGDRIKIRSDSKLKFSTPYTELYDCRIRSYIIVCGRIYYIRCNHIAIEITGVLNQLNKNNSP